MSRFDFSGVRSGHMTVLGMGARRRDPRQRPMWFCRCDCGSLTVTDADALHKGRSKSCGCKGALKRQPPQRRLTILDLFHGVPGLFDPMDTVDIGRALNVPQDEAARLLWDARGAARQQAECAA